MLIGSTVSVNSNSSTDLYFQITGTPKVERELEEYGESMTGLMKSRNPLPSAPRPSTKT